MTEQRPHQNVTLGALALAGTAYSLLQTMVVPALPTLQRDFQASPTGGAWVLTGFLLVSAVATPVLGKLGDQHGKERLLVVSLGIFLLGCVGAATAWNLGSLIAFRCVQGAAGAVFPLSFGIIRDEFPRERVGVGIGLISAVFGVGGGFGIVLGGVIVDDLSWRWIFVVGAVAIAAALVLVVRFVPESPIKTPSRVDLPGAALLSVFLVALLLALTQGESWGWASGRTLGLVAAAALAALAWTRVELRVREPLVDMHVFLERPVLLTNLVALIAGFAMFGVFVLVPYFVETPRGMGAAAARVVHYGFGVSATKAGLLLLPSSLTMLFAGPLAGLLGRRIGMKWPLAIGMLLTAASAASLTLWHDHVWQIVAAVPLLGIGVGAAYAAMATLITEAVRATETGIATGINTVMRTIGGTIGAQIGTMLLTTYTIGATGRPAVTGYEVAFAICAVASVGAAILAAFVTPVRRPPRLALLADRA